MFSGKKKNVFATWISDTFFVLGRDQQLVMSQESNASLYRGKGFVCTVVYGVEAFQCWP